MAGKLQPSRAEGFLADLIGLRVAILIDHGFEEVVMVVDGNLVSSRIEVFSRARAHV